MVQKPRKYYLFTLIDGHDKKPTASRISFLWFPNDNISHFYTNYNGTRFKETMFSHMQFNRNSSFSILTRIKIKCIATRKWMLKKWRCTRQHDSRPWNKRHIEIGRKQFFVICIYRLFRVEIFSNILVILTAIGRHFMSTKYQSF